MNINIYYGGRGIIDDPTLFVINKMQEILEELRVNVTRYNLYEAKNAIPTLPQTLKTRMASFSLLRWSGTVSADICSSFWMPAGCSGTRGR